jgi:hypothetical protein
MAAPDGPTLDIASSAPDCTRAQNDLSFSKIERQCCFYCFVFVNFSIYLSAMDSQGLL